MAQLSDDCFAFGGPLLSIDAALAVLRDRLAPVADGESVALAQALGRVLADDLMAPRAVPPTDNAAVDGYGVAHAAVASDGETVLPVTGRVTAGHSLGRPVPQGEAVRIFTGAPVPAGVDTLYMQEDCREQRAADGGVEVVLPPGLPRGANLRRAGEDVAAGARVLSAGRRLTATDIGLAASVGLPTLPVRRTLTVGLMSTGDEVHEPGTAIDPAGIFDSNRHTTAALLRRAGHRVRDYGILRDQRERLEAVFQQALLEGCDAVVSTGGMSTGEEDHVKQAVTAAGGRVDAWRLSIKPGRPVALGTFPRGAAAAGPGTAGAGIATAEAKPPAPMIFIGLPGNPVAAVICYLFLGRPVLAALQGEVLAPLRRYPVRLGFDYKKKPDRREFVRVTLDDPQLGTHAGAGSGSGDGGDALALPVAAKFPRDGAGILSSLSGSDGVVDLPEGVTRLSTGAIVRFLPFDGVL